MAEMNSRPLLLKSQAPGQRPMKLRQHQFLAVRQTAASDRCRCYSAGLEIFAYAQLSGTDLT